jgi:hypothetical protein
MPTSVTVQQIQQALKQGQLVVPHNLSHTIVSINQTQIHKHLQIYIK